MEDDNISAARPTIAHTTIESMEDENIPAASSTTANTTHESMEDDYTPPASSTTVDTTSKGKKDASTMAINTFGVIISEANTPWARRPFARTSGTRTSLITSGAVNLEASTSFESTSKSIELATALLKQNTLSDISGLANALGGSTLGTITPGANTSAAVNLGASTSFESTSSMVISGETSSGIRILNDDVSFKMLPSENIKKKEEDIMDTSASHVKPEEKLLYKLFVKDGKCPSCFMKLRPYFKFCDQIHAVCNNCSQHINPETGHPEPFTADCGNHYEINFLYNNEFQDVKDICQFGCGLSDNINDLKKHEQDCIYRGEQIICIIKTCTWRGRSSFILKHVEEVHPGHLVVLSKTRKNAFLFETEKSSILIANTDSNSRENSIYWLKFVEMNDKRFILIQAKGSYGTKFEPFGFSSYQVSSTNFETVVNGTVLKNLEEGIKDNTFVYKNGVDVSEIPGNIYDIQMERPEDSKTLRSIRELLICEICQQFLTIPVIQCDKGHSFCFSCARQNDKCCPFCKKNINNIRNFILEAIIQKLDVYSPCIQEGCYVRGKWKDIQEHNDLCCTMVKYTCILRNCSNKWTGTLTNLGDHVWKQHQEHVNEINEKYILDISDDMTGENCVKYFKVMNNNFVLRFYLATNFYFQLYHLSPGEESEFSFQITFKHPDDVNSFVLCQPCRMPIITHVQTGNFIEKEKFSNKIDEISCQQLFKDGVTTYEVYIYRTELIKKNLS